MKWAVSLIFMMITLFVSNAVCAETRRVDLTPEERAWIGQHPVMRVGVLAHWPPFSYTGPDGKLSGIDVDLLDLISQRTGLKFQVVTYESSEALAEDWDHLDAVASVAKSPLREKLADFTEEYAVSPLVIIEREGEEVFGTGAVLDGKKIALPRRNLSTEAITSRLTAVSVILENTQEECFRSVAEEKVDATIVNLFVASQYLNTHPQHKLAISGALVKPILPLRMAVRRGSGPGFAIVNKGLTSISQHELDDIFAKHLLFGLESRHRVGLIQKQARLVLLAVSVAAPLLLLWIFSLWKEIRARRRVEAELREANESMETFSHSISHDLRAPLRAINGFAQLLKDGGHHEKLNPQGQHYLNTIMTSGARMDQMIADVLEYSRTSSSKWPMKPVQLDRLVHELIAGFPPEQRKFFQIASTLPAVQGNVTLLSQCLTNLLSNAIKFVPENRAPHVTIRAKEEPSNVTVFVEDNGIGVDPENQKRIFQLFQRVAPPAYQGTGIGLAVVAKAAQRMGGSAGVESEVDRGSQFWIRLPAASQKSARPARRSSPFWRRFTKRPAHV